MEPDRTLVLLERWHAGDRSALETLLERDLAWIRDRVERRLGPKLRAVGEVEDFVQDAVLEALEYSPRFLMADKPQFRALIARLTENVLRDRIAYLGAKKRDHGGRMKPARDTILAMDPAAQSVARPSQVAAGDEERAWLHLALEMLGSEDRRVVREREFDGRSFVDIAADMGVGEDAVRKRFTRAIGKLARLVADIKSKGIGDSLDAAESAG